MEQLEGRIDEKLRKRCKIGEFRTVCALLPTPRHAHWAARAHHARLRDDAYVFSYMSSMFPVELRWFQKPYNVWTNSLVRRGTPIVKIETGEPDVTLFHQIDDILRDLPVEVVGGVTTGFHATNFIEVYLARNSNDRKIAFHVFIVLIYHVLYWGYER